MRLFFVGIQMLETDDDGSHFKKVLLIHLIITMIIQRKLNWKFNEVAEALSSVQFSFTWVQFN